MRRKAVLLINLGTPDAPETKAVAAYLKQFLSDRRVIQTPPAIWQPLLKVIIRKRAPKSAALYRRIWSPTTGSPLLYYTRRQTRLLQELLLDYTVRYAMSYSEPFIADALKEFEKEGVEDLTIIPLYPQYSTTTVGSVHDDVHRFYLDRQSAPTIHLVKDFADFPPYIKALAKKIQAGIDKYRPDGIIFSYHGIPKSYEKKGDPYAERCRLTTYSLVNQLGLDEKKIPYFQSYQSQFGPNEWLKPATADLLPALPAKGIKKVLVAAPSFVSDCLETIDELGRENRDYFLEAGGTDYHLVDCLNDDPDWIEALAKLTTRK